MTASCSANFDIYRFLAVLAMVVHPTGFDRGVCLENRSRSQSRLPGWGPGVSLPVSSSPSLCRPLPPLLSLSLAFSTGSLIEHSQAAGAWNLIFSTFRLRCPAVTQLGEASQRGPGLREHSLRGRRREGRDEPCRPRSPGPCSQTGRIDDQVYARLSLVVSRVLPM